MRIMQIIHYPGQGGAEQYAYLLAKYAKKNGHDICFVFDQNGPLEARVKELDCEIFYLKMRSPFDPLAITGLSKLYKEWRPDIVQTHFLRENFIAIAANKLTPVKAIFSTVHRIEPKTKIQAAFNRAYSKSLTKFIAVSDITKEYLMAEGINEYRITTVPNGVEILQYKKNKLKKDLGIKENEIVFTCVARLEPEKNHKLVIKAFSQIKGVNYKLLFLGSGSLQKELEGLVSKNKLEKKVIFLNENYIGSEVIGVSNYYIQASKIESFGMTVVEAMLQKIPIIVSDIASFNALTKNGEFGTLFKSDSQKDIKDKILSALEHDELIKKKATLAYKYAITRYTAEIMWRKTEALYKNYL